MLQEVFYWVFNMSITAVFTGIPVMLIRRMKKIPRRFEVFLWVIPFIRMAVPVGLNSPYSLMSFLSGFTTRTIVVYQPTNDLAFSFTNSVMAADSYFPITYKANILENIFHIASVIWLVVAVVMLLLLSVAYMTTMHQIKDSAHWRNNLYLSQKVRFPAVYGIIKPKIVLPASYQNRNITFVLLHEKAHIRSGDNLWRMIAVLLTAIHWFNPLCWLFLECFLTDLELSCDERVLARLDDSQAKDYALSLLEIKQGSTVFSSAFGGSKIRTRIENILSFRKLTWFSLTAFTSLIILICYVLLTNAG